MQFQILKEFWESIEKKPRDGGEMDSKPHNIDETIIYLQRTTEIEAALFKISVVMEAGNRIKYSPGDWKRRKTFQDHMDAGKRHMDKYLAGKEKDEETGCCHLDMAVTRYVMALCYDEEEDAE